MKTVVVVAPHPDDLEIFCGGTVAGHVRDGNRVVEVLVTDGERGSIAGALLRRVGLHYGSAGLGRKRREEARQAAAFLGIELKPLGLSNGKLTCKDHRLILRAVEEENPQLVYAPDPDFPSYRHLDHLEAGRAVSGLRPIRFYHTHRPNLRLEVDAGVKLRALRFHRSQWYVWGILLRRRIGRFEEFRELHDPGIRPAGEDAVEDLHNTRAVPGEHGG